MGTRGTLKIIDRANRNLASFYFQYDSYPEGWPKGLKDFLRNAKMGNGISGDSKFGEYFNGFRDLGAQVIVFLKSDGHKPNPEYSWRSPEGTPRTLPGDEGARYPFVGTVYLTHAEDSQEYNYILKENSDGSVTISEDLLSAKSYLEELRKNNEKDEYIQEAEDELALLEGFEETFFKKEV